MLATFIFSEITPNAAGTAVSSRAVENAASYLAAGIAGPLDDADALDVVAEITGATGGTLDVYVQTSSDEGRSWYDAIHYPQAAAGAGKAIYRASITHHSRATSDSPTVVGSGTSPALAANTVVQGGWGNRVRLVMVAGSGTSAGAALKVTATASRSSR